MSRSLYTAKFKRDYVAYSAVVIFFLIVASEIVLAVSIPVYFVESDMWALQMQRQKLIARFDSLRNVVNNAEIKDDNADAEVKIIGWSLNMMANYLRLSRDRLKTERIDSINKDFDAFNGILVNLKKNQPYNREITVSTEAFLARTADKLPPPLPPGGQQEKK